MLLGAFTDQCLINLLSSLWFATVEADPAAAAENETLGENILASILGYDNQQAIDELHGWQRDVRRFLKRPSQGLLLRCVTGRDLGHNLDETGIFGLVSELEPVRQVNLEDDAEPANQNLEDLFGSG